MKNHIVANMTPKLKAHVSNCLSMLWLLASLGPPIKLLRKLINKRLFKIITVKAPTAIAEKPMRTKYRITSITTLETSGKIGEKAIFSEAIKPSKINAIRNSRRSEIIK
ncbi:MAG: hypothetical protein QXE00_03810 [Candidatus Bathyarchaeia archaeon]